MSGDKLNGRRLHVWHGRNPIEDTISLAQELLHRRRSSSTAMIDCVGSTTVT